MQVLFQNGSAFFSLATQQESVGFGCLSVIFVSMEVTAALTDHLAHLSRLHFSDEEKQEIQKDLEKMVGFVETLAQVDTSGVEPLMHIGQSVNVLRADEIQGSISQEQALQNASGTETAFFQVPKVIRK
jgi:aspartyl-tRNA(Asn)/glutamyl-tRNA(Gln) amidotransferase subunit C